MPQFQQSLVSGIMYIIDLHTHIYPENIAVKATESVKAFYDGLGASGMDGTADMLVRRGKEAGISRFVVLPVAIRPDRVQGINNFIVQQTQLHEEFIGFGTLHAAQEDITGEAQRIMDMGLKGIKMHPDSQCFAIDDPRLFPVYEMIQGKLPVLLHMGDVRYPYSHPKKLRKVLEQFPDLEVVAAHFGGYSMYETAFEELYDKNCIMDISSSLMLMPPGVAEKYIRIYGAERMAYGTDYPMWDPVMEVDRFLKLDLTDEEKEQIAHKTTERFLKLK